jgi:hypothetical protein
MKIPLGDAIRRWWPNSWLARNVFSRTKGISIDLGDHKVHLSEGHGVNRTDPPQFNKPHRLEPPKF